MTHRTHVLVLLLIAMSATGASAQHPPLESWADAKLPVKDGLILWLDASSQAAASKAHDAALVEGDALTTWYDGSGHHRDLAQPTESARPKFSTAGIRFDGNDDHLLRDDANAPPLKEFTAIIVAIPRTNGGGFRGFLSASATGKSDYRTGFNLDLGPTESNEFDDFNAEGAGFGVALNLLGDLAAPLGQSQAITVTGGAPAAKAIKVYFNGRLTGERQRGPADPIAMQRLVLGARSLTNNERPATIRGFLDGDVIEVLLFDRVLTDAERETINAYLSGKHPALTKGADALVRSTQRGTAPLISVKDPPAVQMFVPGFSARELPVDLTNINNLRYRDDGKLIAMAYDGNVYLLSDTDGDGAEDKADLFWDNAAHGGSIRQPIGIALTPPNYKLGRGLFVAGKEKLSLIVDTDGDDKADKEIVAATGWPGSFVNVDALGVAVDPKDQSIYFGLGAANFAEPYLKDPQGISQYKLTSERGTILRLSPDFSKREIVCTGIRFPVGMAFNRDGDLFATDQEGATWAPNGNPLDELLHIQPGRHYGFPARHPTHLPKVIDEPSTFDYAPQHQSTCGLVFNEPVNGGPTFGPESWRGDAIICGESRGKLYRTTLVKTPTGYVARNQLIASLPMLLIDSTVSPRGDLVFCCHSGNPDWGSGPTGKGKLFQIRYAEPNVPQPVLAWPAGPGEVHVAFDRPLDPATLAGVTANTSIVAGRYVAAGDRFEAIRPGYAVVKRQQRAPRDRVDVGSLQLSRDRRTLILGTSTQRTALGHGLTLPGAKNDAIDLAYDLTGISATWTSADGKTSWTGWLPHPDLSVSRTFTIGSAEHDALWPLLKMPGTLRLATALDLRNMLQPAVQPGSQIDFTPAPEQVTVTFASPASVAVAIGAQEPRGNTITVTPKPGEFVPITITLPTGAEAEPTLSVSFTTQEDARPRPMALKRFYVPWAKPVTDSRESLATREPIPQLAGGDWQRGRAVFFGNEAGCAKCHRVRGEGSDLGPDLSNLIHRDYDSVLRDIRDPSGALNPDYIGSTVIMKDRRELNGLVRPAPGADDDRFIVRGDYDGERSPLRKTDVKKITPSPLSMMPTGLPEGLGEAKMRDLLTFLLTEPPKGADEKK